MTMLSSLQQEGAGASKKERATGKEKLAIFSVVAKNGRYRVSVLTAESPPEPKVGESTPFPKVARHSLLGFGLEEV